jgi:uncharacterized protein YcgI (DUF1989 family)
MTPMSINLPAGSLTAKRSRDAAEIEGLLPAAQRRKAPPVVTYPVDALPAWTRWRMSEKARLNSPTLLSRSGEAQTFHDPSGHFFRIMSIEGPRVGDLNLCCADANVHRDTKLRPMKARFIQSFWPHVPPLPSKVRKQNRRPGVRTSDIE